MPFFEKPDIFHSYRGNNSEIVVTVDHMRDEPAESWYTLILMPILMIVGIVGNGLVSRLPPSGSFGKLPLQLT